jgi:hypothetical protein
MLIKRISEGEIIPRFYGLAWRDYYRNKAVCLPLGLNLFVALIRSAYVSLMHGSKAVASNPRDAYRQGLADGRVEAERAWRPGPDA